MSGNVNVIGHTNLTPEQIDFINRIKSSEIDLAKLHKEATNFVKSNDLPMEAMRQLAIARTEFENSYMRFVRAIAGPKSPWVETDEYITNLTPNQK